MLRKALLLALSALVSTGAFAGFVPVAVSGYNADVIANGVGSASSSTNNDVDGVSYAFVAQDFQATSTATGPTYYLPNSGLISSANTPGLSFQLASYSGNNALRLPAQNASGTLLFTTPTSAGEIFVMGTGGSGDCTADILVTFTDNTTQLFSGLTQFADWYPATTNVTVAGVGRVNRSTNALEGSATGGPKLYEAKLVLLPANHSKQIASITITKMNSGTAVLNILGVSINTPCVGTPVAGTVSTSSSVCSGVAFNLATTGTTNGVGITYQWESSSNGTTWAPITGATTVPYTVSAGQTAATYYRLQVSCNGGTPVATPALQIGLTSPSQCYCVPPPNTTSNAPCTSTDYIQNFFTTGNLTNIPSNAGCINQIYIDRTNISTSAMQQSTANFTLVNGSTAEGYRIWVDWNQNGTFEEPGELVYGGVSVSANATVNGSFTVPLNAVPGTTRMRIRNVWNTSNFGPCTVQSYGQVIDYSFVVVAMPPCTAPSAQPTALALTAGATTVYASFTAAAPAADKYLVVRTSGAALNATPVGGTVYTVGASLGNGTIVSIGSGLTFTDPGLTPSTSYAYTVFAYNDQCIGGPLYATTNPLTGTVATPALGIYTWNGSVSTDWQVAANWTPARTLTDASDVLLFNNGAVNLVTNIPTQTVRRVAISNNTRAQFQSPAAATLTFASDNIATTNELDITAGSALIDSSTAAALTLAFSGTGGTANIAGNLEIWNATPTNVINFTNTIATVASTGTLAAGGTNGATAITSTAANLLVNGTYRHKYTTSSGGAVPTATWNAGSTVLISGYTTATGGPNGGMGQTFSNFTYNCPNQTSTTNWSGTGPLTVTGNFTLASTGTGTLAFTSTTAYNYTVNNYIQSGGALNLASGTVTSATNLNITGSFSQTGGSITTSGSPTGLNVPNLNFAGTAGMQSVAFSASPTARVVLRVSNPAGINLVGNGGLTGLVFDAEAGLRISTTAANPVTTALTLTYNTGSRLTYDATGTLTATANVWTTGVPNVTLALGSITSVLNVPFSRTINGTLNMTSGDMDIASNTLTIGTSATATGTLTYSAGFIRTTTGSLVRWFGTTGLPTSAGNGIGFYPLGANGASRAVSLYFSGSTALSTGGTVSLGHTAINGLTTGLTVPDGAYTINSRTNASWQFGTGNGIAASGTMLVRIVGANLFTSPTPANLRVMQATSVAGVHVPGAVNTAIRSGLSINDLNASYYIGAAAADINGYFIAITTGNWSNGAIWDGGVAPVAGNDALINPGVTVTVDVATNAAKNLVVAAGGNLTANANVLTIGDALTNNGTITVGGGTLNVNGQSTVSAVSNSSSGVVNLSSGSFNIGTTLNGRSFANSGTLNISGGTYTQGITGGGNAPFSNTSVLTVSGGSMTVNGNMNFSSASAFSQSGGAIRVDGNAGGVAANSVASGTPIVLFSSANINLTGGTFTIVDPHAVGTNTLNYSNGSHVNILPPHTFIFGDGTSADASTNSDGFLLNTWVGSGRISFGHFVVNGPNVTNRWVRNFYSLGINGNFTMNGGEYWPLDDLHLNGNMTVNAGALFTSNTSYTLRFGQYLSGSSSPSTTAQTVSGAGTFRNSQSPTPTAKFSYITLSNSAGVTFNVGDVSFSNTLTFVAGASGPSRMIVPAAARAIEISGAGQSGASATNGWVFGTYQKAAATGTLNNIYPIGDATSYTPLTISGGAGGVTTAGAIAVSSIAGDHPSLNTATINPLRSVNRVWKVQGLNGIAFGAGLITVKPTWAAADLDPGTTPAALIMGRYNSTAWTYPTVSAPAATTISGLVAGTSIDGDYAVGQACVPTAITTQPQAATACLGGAATFTVAATGADGFTYQWQKGGTNIPGATNASYTITNATAGDAGNYTVVLTSPCATVAPLTSAIAALNVNQPAAITAQPVPLTVCQRRSATFTVAATNAASYQWRKNGGVIAGATSATYTIPNVVPGDAGNYSVDVIPAAPCATIASNAVALTVNPLDNTATAGGTTNFCTGGSVTLNAVNTANVTYQWYNGTTLIGGATSASYTASASGNYVVVVTNTNSSCKDTSAPITVSVGTPPTASVTPASGAVCAGNSFVFNGPALGGVTFQWKRDGNDIPGATSASYAATIAGTYTLVVASGPNCASTSTGAVLTVNPLPSAAITAGTATTVCQGDSVLLQSNTATGFTYQWRLNGSPMAGATAANYWAKQAGNWTVAITNGNGCTGISNAIAVNLNALPVATITPASATTFCAGINVVLNANTGSNLTYQWLSNNNAITGFTTSSYTASSSASYRVQVTNTTTGCSALSPAIAVTANPLPVVSTTPPAGPAGICAGSQLTISVPSGTGTTYQWRKDTSVISGATNASYVASTSGSYTVHAVVTATGCAATSQPVVVTVNPLPTVTITPAGQQSICETDTLQLSSTATGTGLSYQWKLGTTNIPGATLPTFNATAAGSHTLTVTNQFGCSATSAAMVLTLKPKPLSYITYQSPVSFCQGGAVVLSANNTQAGLTYEWFRDGQPFTNSAYFYSASGSGNYTVKVTNSVGCSRLSAPVSVTVNAKPQPVIVESPAFVLRTAANNYASYQWYRNNLAIPGASAATYNVQQNGSYSVHVVDTNGCENTSAQHLISTLAVRNPAAAAAIRIYPNPTSGVLHIAAPQAVKVVIRDMRGSTVYSQDKVQTVDLSNLADGLYMVLVSDLDGQLLKMERVNKSAR